MNSAATNTNVRAFADIGLEDLEQVGGKNSSLGEMVSNLSALGVNVPDGFATTAEAYHRFIGDTGLAQEISEKLRGLDTDDTQQLARVGREIREAVAHPGVPRGPRGRHPHRLRGPGRRARRRLLRRALQRHRRGPARRLLRRPAGDLPQHPGHRRGAAGRPRGLRLPVQRPGHRLPGAPRLRPRRRGPLGRGPADGALRRRRLRGDVHDGHRVRLHRRGLRHLLLRPGRGGGAGGGQPRRVLRLQAGPARGPAGGAQAGGGIEGDQDGLHRGPDRRTHHRVRRPREGRARPGSASPTPRWSSSPATR